MIFSLLPLVLIVVATYFFSFFCNFINLKPFLLTTSCVFFSFHFLKCFVIFFFFIISPFQFGVKYFLLILQKKKKTFDFIQIDFSFFFFILIPFQDLLCLVFDYFCHLLTFLVLCIFLVFCFCFIIHFFLCF